MKILFKLHDMSQNYSFHVCLLLRAMFSVMRSASDHALVSSAIKPLIILIWIKVIYIERKNLPHFANSITFACPVTCWKMHVSQQDMLISSVKPAIWKHVHLSVLITARATKHIIFRQREIWSPDAENV